MSPVHICKSPLLRLKEKDGCLQINSSAQRTCVAAFGMFHLAFKSFHLHFTFLASDLVLFPHLQMVSCPARLCFLPKWML